MRPYTIVEAPSRLGLRASGVEHLPAALMDAGLARALAADTVDRVASQPFDPRRDPITRVLNGPAIARYAGALADVVAPLVRSQRFPVVLGGDCSILLGPMLALRRLGRFGLVHVDGHADFYQAEAEVNGEVASMDLALVTGRGPALLSDLEGLRPLVRDADVVQVGSRDAAEAAAQGSHDIRATSIRVLDLNAVRTGGADRVAEEAVAHVTRDEVRGNLDPSGCGRARRRGDAGGGLSYGERAAVGGVERGGAHAGDARAGSGHDSDDLQPAARSGPLDRAGVHGQLGHRPHRGMMWRVVQSLHLLRRNPDRMISLPGCGEGGARPHPSSPVYV